MRTQVDYYKSGALMKKREKAHTFFIDAENAQDALNKLERAKEIVDRRGVWVVHKNADEIKRDNSYEYRGYDITLTKEGFTVVLNGKKAVFKMREQAEKFVDLLIRKGF